MVVPHTVYRPEAEPALVWTAEAGRADEPDVLLMPPDLILRGAGVSTLIMKTAPPGLVVKEKK